MPYIEVPILRGFREIERLFDLCGTQAYICGGYARYCCSQRKRPIPAQDCDVFPASENAFGTLKDALLKIGFEAGHENAVSLSLKLAKKANVDAVWRSAPHIQLIKPMIEGRVVTVGSLDEILENFDFSITRAAIVSPVLCRVDEDFVKDDVNGVLRLKNIHCPISSMLRCMKYARKGYWMRPSEALMLFLDWDERGPDYKAEIIELFKQSAMKTDTGEQIKMERREIDRLEALLRRD